MLTIPGEQLRLCDGLSRRSFLQLGSLAMGGLSLPELLRAEAAAGVGSSHKAVIMVFLSGGPPHQDMFDLKPAAPVEYRGEFSPIATSVPGIQICEHLPRLAARMNQLAVIRTLVGSEGRHASFQCMTGQSVQNQPPGGWPSLGSVVSKLQGPVDRATPPFVSLSPRMKSDTWSDPGQAGFAGQAHAPFTPNAGGAANLVLQGITPQTLHDRRTLLKRIDRFRREVDSQRGIEGVDSFYEQAFGILTSNRLVEALDLSREDPQLRDRYGRGSSEPAGYGDAGPLLNDYLLAARRLVEVGVRVVTLAYGRWDWHGQPHGTNFENARDHFPRFDQGLSTLLDDLQERGLANDVSVVVWGEFGRTPRVNPNGGRDHWPLVASALLAGGGIRTGQAIGQTNRLAEHATERPVHFQEVFATLYRNLGIDVGSTTLNDVSGRPHYLVDHQHYEPIRELV